MRAQSVIAFENDRLSTPSISTIRPEHLRSVQQYPTAENRTSTVRSNPETSDALSRADEALMDPRFRHPPPESHPRSSSSQGSRQAGQISTSTSADKSRGSRSTASNQSENGLRDVSSPRKRTRQGSAEDAPDDSSHGDLANTCSRIIKMGRLELHMEVGNAGLSFQHDKMPSYRVYHCEQVEESDIVVDAEKLDYENELCILKKRTTEDLCIVFGVSGQAHVKIHCTWNRI